MAMTFPSCATCNNCDDLLKEIQRRMYSSESGGDKGLMTRLAEQIYGCQTPANTVSSHASCAGHRMQGTWDGHNASITTQQDRLKKSIKDYDDNDCGDKVANPQQARNFMRGARRAAYNISPPTPGDYVGPPAPAQMAIPRTWGEAAADGARGVCVGGLATGGAVGGAVVGGVGGAAVGGVAGGVVGGVSGTMALPGGGTIGGAAAGAATGTVVGAGVGAVAGGYGGYQGGQALGEWLCY